MRRREFLGVVGCVAAAWPVVARGQQAERMLRVGVLSSSAADDPGNQIRFAAFQQRLQQLGWIDGRNLRIDHRWAAANAENYRNTGVTRKRPR